MNTNFIRIMRFAPKVEFCRGTGFTFKRITLIGHDGSKHSFAVQMPTQLWVRREERIQQLFRIFNGYAPFYYEYLLMTVDEVF